jgi:DNA-binding MarR family transcriptional regulator
MYGILWDMSESNHFLTDLDLSKVTTYQAGIMQSTVHRLISKDIGNSLKKYNLTMMEWFAFGFIYDRQPVRVSELSKHLDFTMPYATNLINSLQTKGFVTRSDDSVDNRNKPLELTAVALGQYEAIERDVRDSLRESVYSRVLPDDFQIYVKVLFELGQW